MTGKTHRVVYTMSYTLSLISSRQFNHGDVNRSVGTAVNADTRDDVP
jgi:hypothetical protein